MLVNQRTLAAFVTVVVGCHALLRGQGS